MKNCRLLYLIISCQSVCTRTQNGSTYTSTQRTKRKPHHCRNHSKIIRWFINQISFAMHAQKCKTTRFSWVIPIVELLTYSYMRSSRLNENNTDDDFRLCKQLFSFIYFFFHIPQYLHLKIILIVLWIRQRSRSLV